MAARFTIKEGRAYGIQSEGQKYVRRKKVAANDEIQGRNQAFDAMCVAHQLPIPVHEFEFAKELGRGWKFDALFSGWCALEIEGNPWASVNGQKSRHFHGQGILDDILKYNEAAILGYTVLRCTWKDVESGAIFATVKRCLVGGDQ